MHPACLSPPEVEQTGALAGLAPVPLAALQPARSVQHASDGFAAVRLASVYRDDPLFCQRLRNDSDALPLGSERLYAVDHIAWNG